VPATTAKSLVEGLSHDYIGDDREMRALVPQRLLTFRESVAVTLEAEKTHHVPARWVEGPLPAATGTEVLVLRQEVLRRARDERLARGAVRRSARQFAATGLFSYRALWWLRRAFDWPDRRPELPRRPPRSDTAATMGDVVDGWRVLA